MEIITRYSLLQIYTPELPPVIIRQTYKWKIICYKIITEWGGINQLQANITYKFSFVYKKYYLK